MTCPIAVIIDVVERFVASCNECIEADAWALLAPKVVVSVAGSTWFSGRFEGEEQVRRILLATLRQYLRAPRAVLLDVIAGGDQVAALIEVSGRARDGASFSSAGAPWGIWFELLQGRITSISVFPDTLFLETVLCGAIYRPNDASRVLG